MIEVVLADKECVHKHFECLKYTTCYKIQHTFDKVDNGATKFITEYTEESILNTYYKHSDCRSELGI